VGQVQGWLAAVGASTNAAGFASPGASPAEVGLDNGCVRQLLRKLVPEYRDAMVADPTPAADALDRG
jgi:hypothetical protein